MGTCKERDQIKIPEVVSWYYLVFFRAAYDNNRIDNRIWDIVWE